MASGLRAGELLKLEVRHLDLDNGGVHLEAGWTKNREAGFIHLGAGLASRLAASARAGAAIESYRRAGSRRRAPANPLVFVPKHTARELAEDLEAAGIPLETDEGKVVFHSLRNTAISRIIEAGASVREAQEFARHSTPQLTMNLYARVQKERMQVLAEGLELDLPETGGDSRWRPRGDPRAAG